MERKAEKPRKISKDGPLEREEKTHGKMLFQKSRKIKKKKSQEDRERNTVQYQEPKFIKTKSVHGIWQFGGLWYSCKNPFSAEVGWGGGDHIAMAMA